MANASGGVVIFGVDEDDQARASRLCPVQLSDENHRKLVGSVYQLVAPVPDYKVQAIPSGDDGRGYYLVVVAGSPLAPHAVLKGERLTFPVREHAQTRNMREPEIAARYRDRFQMLTSRVERTAAVHLDGIRRIPRTAGHVWLTLALTPEQPGRADITNKAVAESREWLRAWQQGHTPRGPFSADLAATTGKQRLVHSSEFNYTGTSSDWHLELHNDGSGYGAVRLSPDPVFLEHTLTGPPVHAAPIRELESLLPTLLSLLAGHSERAASGGALLTRCQLVTAADPDAMWTAPDGRAYGSHSIHPTLTLTNPISGRAQRVPGTHSVAVPDVTEQTLAHSVAVDPADLLSAAAQIAGELMSEFGQPDPMTINREGWVLLNRATDPSLVAWAERNGLSVTRLGE